MKETEVFVKRKTRSTYEQLAVILETCNEPKHSTQLYNALATSHPMFKKVLKEAIYLKLLQKTRKHYILTAKGVEYLCKWGRFLAFLKGEE